MIDKHITLAHGNGGRFMRELIDDIFVKHLGNPQLNVHQDAAALPLPTSGIPMITTDGFTVNPLLFPGGDIGSLAIHGTVNDLAVAGADPLYLTLNAFIEEGLEYALLDRLVASMAEAAKMCSVSIVAGDTKVVPHGMGGGLYLATTGIGMRSPKINLGLDRIQSGDRLLVSGPVGDHGTAVMLAREAFGLRGDLRSDSASIHPLTRRLRTLPGVRFMRDPTRGGLATVAHELALATGRTVRLVSESIPIREPVRAVCDILGYDPLYLACEGRLVAVVAPETAEATLATLKTLPGGKQAALIGQLEPGEPDVIVVTPLGGERRLLPLEEDPLPRIC
ncbi:MAG: hydrogenase expression/formation protein HypE [Magnetococcales bacterium]|nr:hydrogenase expression/formation protein HypE [Magnetococcales bacterium]